MSNKACEDEYIGLDFSRDGMRSVRKCGNPARFIAKINPPRDGDTGESLLCNRCAGAYSGFKLILIDEAIR